MAISSTTAAASTGVATVSGVSLSGVQLTIDPGTVAGDVTVEAKPIGLTAYEDVLDSAGVALSVSAPSAQVTYFISGHFEAVRATSSNTGDTFDLVVIGNDHVDAADIRAAVGLSTANLDTQLAAIDTVADAVLVDTGTTIPAQIAALNDLSAAEVNAEVDTALADYDGPTKAEMDAGFGALSIPTATENADALLNRDMDLVSDTSSRSPLNALRFLRNKWSVTGATLTVTKEDDSSPAWTATLTSDASANPVTGSDPT